MTTIFKRPVKLIGLLILGGCGVLSTSAAPSIQSQPQSLTNCAGQSALFSVTATGNGPLSYQWKLGATDIPLAVDPTYTILSPQPADAGAYSVVVTDADGPTPSDPAVLTVIPAVTNWALSCIATQSSTYNGTAVASRGNDGNTDGVFGNNSVTHSSANPAIGTPAVVDNERAWQVDLTAARSIGRVVVWLRSDCCGERNTNLVVQVYDASYTLVFSRTNISATPTTATLVYEFAPAITGRYVRVQNLAAPAHPLSVAEVQVFSAVTGATLAVSQNPANTTVNEFATATLGPVAATVTPNCSTVPFSYQWLRNELPVAGATAATYAFTAGAADNTAQYRAVIWAPGLAPSTTDVATLTVTPVAPSITTQPANILTRMAGGVDTFSVAAFGTAPVTYQWYSNDVAIADAIANTYSVSNLPYGSSGNFTLVAANSIGSVTSVVATLTVLPVSGISYDFNSPGQFTNVMYRLVDNDWIGTLMPSIIWETNTGGANGSGGLDVTGTADTSIILPAMGYDFSVNGKTLVASTMVKIAAPTQNNRNTQLGFVTGTNIWNGTTANGISDINPQGFMSVILQSTVQPALAYQLRLQHRRTDGGIAEVIPVQTTSNLLTAGTWYKLVGTFANIKGSKADTITFTATLQDMGANGVTPGANIISYAPTNIVNTSLVNQRAMYLAVRTARSDTGADFWDNIYACSQPGNIFFVTQPAAQSVLQGRGTVFRAYVDGAGPYSYQWQKSDGSGGFTNIPAAVNWKYILTTASVADNDTQFRVQVTGPANSLTSDPATLTVQADPLAVVSTGSPDGTTIGVQFNQPLDKASAETAANYSINGAAAVKAVLRADGASVLLTSGSLLSGSFTVDVQNVLDLSGGALGPVTSAAGRVANLVSADISQANTVISPPGTTYSFAPDSFEITAGGVDIWNLSDAFRFVYSPREGDFDVKMRVPYVDIVNASTKAALMARVSLDPTSPNVAVAANPMWPARDYFEGSRRSDYNVASTGWGTSTAGSAKYPNAWLRFRRVANTFSRYSSTNGVTWTLDGQTSLILPSTLYMGFAVCSVRNGVPPTPVLAKFDNYGEFAGYPGAVITLATQPAASVTIAAGATAALSAGATVTGAAATELAYCWQRADGSGGWTNLVSAGVNNGNLTTAPLFIYDNGAQFRCVVSLLGALSVTSSVATVTVTDTAAPAVTSSTLPALSIYNYVVYFSEPMGASAIDPANYVLTNRSGVNMNVTSAVLLNGDPRAVLLTTSEPLTANTYGVRISTSVLDINGNAVAANTVRTFNQTATPPALPVVHEVYQDIGAVVTVSALTGHALYTAGTPTFITYSNVFGFNAAIGSSLTDNYGVKSYTYFVPPTNGQYKFWIRSDDGLELWMNTNGSDAVTFNSSTVYPSSANFPAAESPNNLLDHATGTKYLNFDKLNTGFSVTPVRGASVVTAIQFSTANDAPERDPLTFTLEGTTGNPTTGPWTLLASGSTGWDTDPGRQITTAAIPVANSASYTSYRVLFPTIRNEGAANSMQISEVWLLNSSGADVCAGMSSSGVALVAANAAANGTYSIGGVAGSITNITLTAGKAYYMMALFKEATGNEGYSVMWTDPKVTAAPAATTFIPLANLAYPTNAAPATPVVTELYLNYPTPYGTIALNGSAIADMDTALTNWPYNAFWAQSLPSATVYQKYFATQPSLVHTRYDNYLGRMYAFFVPPSNGLYRFYVASDDSSRLFINTNAVNSTDPAGATLQFQLAAYNGTYSIANTASNIALVGGQKYFMQVIWKEGTGGDGARVAVRANADTTIPPATEVIPASMLAFPYGIDRVGAVGLAGITPSAPVAPEGSTLTLSALGVNGAPPYSYIWLKNGQQVYYGTPFQNSPIFTTQPLTASDNGAVLTLVVTNLFSRVERSVTLTVVAGAPTLLSAIGNQYGNGVTLNFNAALDPTTAQSPGSYSIAGLTILGASLDATATRVTLVTTPQTPSQLYTVAVNGVRNALLSTAITTTKNFTAWGYGGSAVLVEMFTNINGTLVANLTNDPRYIGNFPDVWGYVNKFGYDSRAGQAATASLNGYGPFVGDGLAYYGVRISAYFVAPSNGLYRFYIRSDDMSALYMNTNGMDPAGKVLIAQVNITCCKAYSDASGGNNNSFLQVGNIALTGGQLYYMEYLGKEGGGGDTFTMAFREAGDPSAPADTEVASAAFFTTAGNPDFASITVNQAPPTEISVAENDLVTLTASVTVLPASLQAMASYQWQKLDLGAGLWVNIPGATTATYTFFAPLADDGATYRFHVSVPGVERNLTTLLHVSQDFIAPSIVSAGSYDGNTIIVQFNERVDVATAFEGLNWQVNWGANSIASIAARSNIVAGVVQVRLDQLVLTLENPVSGPFTVYAENINDMASMPNVGASSVEAIVVPFFAQDVGVPLSDPAFPGRAYMFASNSIDIVASGTDVWTNSDGMHYVYRQVAGNFDIKTRLNSLAAANTWSKAGLMARSTTNANSRNIAFFSTPPASSGGQDTFTFQYRDTETVGSGSFYKSIGAGVFTNVPSAFGTNVWLRLKREGTLFSGFISSNGLDWIAYTNRVNSGLPASLLVGFATTSHDNTAANKLTLAEFRDIYFPDVPTITTHPVGGSFVIHQSTALAVAADSSPDSGPVTYQWLKNGVIIPGATQATLMFNNLASADAASYTVAVANDGGGALSDPAIVTVLNLPPVVAPKTITKDACDFTATAAELLAGDVDPEGDALTILGVSGVPPVTFTADFNDGLLPPGTITYGNAIIVGAGGVGDSGNLHLTESSASQAGAFLINDLVPGRSVSAFTARFKIRVGDGSANPADGFSFNLGKDLVDGTVANCEDGVGTGLSICIDNYDSGGGEAPALDVKYAGVFISHVMMPKLNDPRWIDMAILLAADGALTFQFDGTNVVTGLATGYVPMSGARFGLYARTGGQTETHWIDDVVITVQTADTAGGGRLAYNPATGLLSVSTSGLCALDTFYYAVSDGQVDGVVYNAVTVQHRPLARNDQMSAVTALPSVVSLAKIRMGDFNPDGFPLDFAFTQPAHGTLTIVDDVVTYTGAAGFTGADAWTYTIQDSRGLASTATVSVMVYSPNRGSANIVASGIRTGKFWASFAGLPGKTYRVETTVDVVNGPWVPLMDAVAGRNGLFEITDTVNNPADGQRFYRTVAP